MLMIERVVSHRDDSTGTTATLTLVDPQAYGGQGVGGGESAPIWDVFGGDGQSGAAAPRLGSGNDTAYAGDGHDDVYADGAIGETSTLFLEEGDDEIHAGLGVDRIDGGRGQDLAYYYLSAAGVTVNLRADTGAGGYAQGDTYRFVEDVQGSFYNDVLIGNGVSNVLEGYGGNDYINGGGGADFMFGGAGYSDTLAYGGSVAGVTVNLATGTATGGDATYDEFYEFENLLGSSFADRLTGNAEANRLTGGDGADRLTGDIDTDILTGGAGADRFVYLSLNDSSASATGRDRIADFSPAGDDRIDLSLIDANTAAIGNQVFGFVGTGAFTAAGQVAYQQAGGNTFVFADVDGDAVADFSIALTGTHTLAGVDFVL